MARECGLQGPGGSYPELGPEKDSEGAGTLCVPLCSLEFHCFFPFLSVDLVKMDDCDSTKGQRGVLLVGRQAGDRALEEAGVGRPGEDYDMKLAKGHVQR